MSEYCNFFYCPYKIHHPKGRTFVSRKLFQSKNQIMKFLSPLLCILFFATRTFIAQTINPNFEKDFDAAEKIFAKVYQEGKNESFTYSKGGFNAAIPLFKELYKQDPS